VRTINSIFCGSAPVRLLAQETIGIFALCGTVKTSRQKPVFHPLGNFGTIQARV
jgi:threonine synthase